MGQCTVDLPDRSEPRKQGARDMANLSEKIVALRGEAAQAGDTMQVVLCDIAEGVYGDNYTFDCDDFTTLPHA